MKLLLLPIALLASAPFCLADTYHIMPQGGAKLTKKEAAEWDARNAEMRKEKERQARVEKQQMEAHKKYLADKARQDALDAAFQKQQAEARQKQQAAARAADISKNGPDKQAFLARIRGEHGATASKQ